MPPLARDLGRKLSPNGGPWSCKLTDKNQQKCKMHHIDRNKNYTKALRFTAKAEHRIFCHIHKYCKT